MTISNEGELDKLKTIGRIVSDTLDTMGAALEPGMTTAELDGIGRALLEKAGARSAPELYYRFPGATCISVNEEIAHGIPGKSPDCSGRSRQYRCVGGEGRRVCRYGSLFRGAAYIQVH